MAAKNFEPNKIIIHDDYAEVVIISSVHGEKHVLIDIEDIDTIKKYRWHVHLNKTNQNTFYAEAEDYISKKERHTIKMHRIILNCPKDMVVDHINHDGLDNRKDNLRICTRRENSNNRLPVISSGCARVGSRTGIRYISVYRKHNRKYYIYKVSYKGYRKEFRTIEEAKEYLEDKKSEC